jgi:hypothetical protein
MSDGRSNSVVKIGWSMIEMTDEEIPRDVSLLKCTYKKTKHVTEKVVKYFAYAVIWGIIGLGVIAGLYLLYLAVMRLSSLWSILYGTFFGAIGLFYLIPWWIYVIIAAIVAIPAYSFAWCLNRDLTDVDKKVDANDPNVLNGLIIGAIIGGSIGLYKGYIIGYNFLGYPFAESIGVIGAVVGGFFVGVMGAIIGDLYVVFSRYYIRKKNEAK